MSLRMVPAPMGREGKSGAIIGMHMHDKTSTTAHSKDRQQHSKTIKTGASVFKRAGRGYSASLATGAQKSTPGSPMPPPWNGRGAVVRGEKVGNTGRALAWCVAYQILKRRAGCAGAARQAPNKDPRSSPTIWPSVLSHVSLFDSASLLSRVRLRPSLAT